MGVKLAKCYSNFENPDLPPKLNRNVRGGNGVKASCNTFRQHQNIPEQDATSEEGNDLFNMQFSQRKRKRKRLEEVLQESNTIASEVESENLAGPSQGSSNSSHWNGSRERNVMPDKLLSARSMVPKRLVQTKINFGRKASTQETLDIAQK